MQNESRSSIYITTSVDFSQEQSRQPMVSVKSWWAPIFSYAFTEMWLDRHRHENSLDPLAYKLAHEHTENPLAHVTKARETSSWNPLLRHQLAEAMDALHHEMHFYLENKWVEHIVTENIDDFANLFAKNSLADMKQTYTDNKTLVSV